MAEAPRRSRRYDWVDPGQLARETRGISGQEFYAAWKEGQLIPPMAATLGFYLLGYGEGRVEIGCTPDELHYSPYGMVHGGLAATLLDTATGCALHTLLPAGTGYATLNLNVSYLRRITAETGPMVCVGTVSSQGSRVAVAEAELIDDQDRRFAQATSTCLIIEPDPQT